MVSNTQVIDAALVYLGSSMEAATFIQDDQGMGSLEELHLLTNTNVEMLCKGTHCPGSMIDNPSLPAPESGPHPQIANLGILVNQHTEKNLKLVTYYLKYKEKTSRVVTLADITLSNICELREHCNLEAAHKNVEPLELTLNWPRNMENLDEYLHSCLGETQIMS